MEGMIEEVGTKKAGTVGLRLMPRDLDILTFLFEQKFASLPVLYYRFFDRREKIEDELPENFWVTRQRLMILKGAGLITAQRVYTDSKAVYLLTQYGYDILKNSRELSLAKEPITAVDYRYYEHDRRVTLCRVALERHGKCLRWFSDRYLQHKKGYPLLSGKFFRFPPGLIPDGVFISSKNEFVALELEHTHKRRERYREKRFAYQDLLGGLHSFRRREEEPPLHRVLFVATTDRVGKDLQEYFGELSDFQVLSFEKLVGGCLGRDALV